MKKQLLLTTMLVLTSFMAKAQEPCSFDKHQTELEAKNPEIKKAREEAEARVLVMNVSEYVKKLGVKSNTSKNAAATTIYEVPVVVHILVPTGVAPGSAGNPSDAEITTWIDNVNRMYATTLGGVFPAEGTATGGTAGTVIPFKLVLAKRNPSCTATTGVIRYNPNSSAYDTYGIKDTNASAYTIAQMRTLAPHWPEGSYYNMYIIKGFDGNFSDSGLMGWAGLPTNPDSDYETVMKAPVVTKPNDITLGHEFCHSLGLLHPFGSESGNGGGVGTANCPATTGVCATDDDKVCDTQRTKSLLSVWPVPSNTDNNDCTSTPFDGVQYNIMNYSQSQRYFTPGQRDRALAIFMPLRGSLTTSLGGTAPVTDAATVSATTCIPPNAPTTTGNFSFGPVLVKLGSINNVSAASNTGNANKVFYDYTTQSCISNSFKTNLVVASNPQAITLKCITNPNVFSVWIDYNNNGTFESTELVVTDKTIAIDVEDISNFTIPSTGVTLNTPLRMRVIGDDGNNSTTPCGTRGYGQVEDYEVTISATLATNAAVITENTFTLYPNPTNSGYLNVDFDNNVYNNYQYQIYNVVGSIVQSGELTNKKINVSKLSSNMYMIRLFNDNQSIVKKIVVKN